MFRAIEIQDCWITLEKKPRGKPKLEFKIRLCGTRTMTREEKNEMRVEKQMALVGVEDRDEETLRNIHDRNPHLFNDTR